MHDKVERKRKFRSKQEKTQKKKLCPSVKRRI